LRRIVHTTQSSLLPHTTTGSAMRRSRSKSRIFDLPVIRNHPKSQGSKRQSKIRRWIWALRLTPHALSLLNLCPCHWSSAFGALVFETGVSPLMGHLFPTIGTNAVPAGPKSPASAHASSLSGTPLALTSALTSASTSALSSGRHISSSFQMVKDHRHCSPLYRRVLAILVRSFPRHGHIFMPSESSPCSFQ
jgi:hypothetical protein